MSVSTEQLMSLAAELEDLKVAVSEGYADRNMLVVLAASLAGQLGYRVSRLENPEDPEWPIVVIGLPSGAIVYPIPQETLPAGLPEASGTPLIEPLKIRRNRILRFVRERGFTR